MKNRNGKSTMSQPIDSTLTQVLVQYDNDVFHVDMRANTTVHELQRRIHWRFRSLGRRDGFPPCLQQLQFPSGKQRKGVYHTTDTILPDASVRLTMRTDESSGLCLTQHACYKAVDPIYETLMIARERSFSTTFTPSGDAPHPTGFAAFLLSRTDRELELFYQASLSDDMRMKSLARRGRKLLVLRTQVAHSFHVEVASTNSTIRDVKSRLFANEWFNNGSMRYPCTINISLGHTWQDDESTDDLPNGSVLDLTTRLPGRCVHPGAFKHDCLALDVSRELLARMPMSITTVQDALFVRNAIQYLQLLPGDHDEALGRLRMERLKWLLETNQRPIEAISLRRKLRIQR